MKNDPKEPLEWKCTDDAPVNTGNSELDYDEIRRSKWREEMEEENENPDKDDFDSGDWGERFD